MTRILVNDASCLIDLRKGGLLEELCRLPYRVVVPLPIREHEMLDMPPRQWRALEAAGMITRDLTPEEIGQAIALKARHPGLSANDCFCLVTAKAYAGILLTGDAALRRVAIERGLRAHGVLWIVDEFYANGSCARTALIRALNTWKEDRAVFFAARRDFQAIGASRARPCRQSLQRVIAPLARVGNPHRGDTTPTNVPPPSAL